MRLLLLLLIGGILSCIPAIILETVLEPFVNVFAYIPLLFYAVDAFIVVALSEEISKYFFLKLISWRSREFNSTFDGIIYSVFTGKKIDEIVAQYEGSGYGQFKKDLVEIVNNYLAPIQEKYYDIRQSDELIRVLKEGTEKASAVAERTMKRVREKVGFINI